MPRSKEDRGREKWGGGDHLEVSSMRSSGFALVVVDARGSGGGGAELDEYLCLG